MSETESVGDEISSHSASLKRLKDKDPDFYDFLKENDQELLDFNNSELDEEEEDDVEDTEDSKPQPITAATIEFFKKTLLEDPTAQVCKELIAAFKSAVAVADSSNKQADMSSSELFNDIVRLCLVELAPALYKVLKLTKGVDPSKSRVWKSMSTSIKSYLIDMLKMLSVLKESSVLLLLLKHIVHLLPFYSKFIKLSKLLLKKIVSLWSTSEEAIRVLALLIIVRMVKRKEYLELTLKMMYFSYVRNTKFTSPLTWPLINFMKQSLMQVYLLNPDIAYQHAFIYIRQLSIHLRNALTTRKTEAVQTVYNWQFIHCIFFWTQVLCALHENEAIKGLLYPLVQIAIGTINLNPTQKYVPLRFQLVKALIQISKESHTFVPVLPFILDVLKMTDFNKKSTFSAKPIDFTCALKVTKSQLLEAGFKDSCINEVCHLLMEYLHIYSHEIGFPELVLPAVLQIRAFAKQCKVGKYGQQLKVVLGLLTENSAFISDKRLAVTFKITDEKQIAQFENKIKEQGTPISQSLNKIKNEDKMSNPKKKQKIV